LLRASQIKSIQSADARLVVAGITTDATAAANANDLAELLI